MCVELYTGSGQGGKEMWKSHILAILCLLLIHTGNTAPHFHGLGERDREGKVWERERERDTEGEMCGA